MGFSANYQQQCPPDFEAIGGQCVSWLGQRQKYADAVQSCDAKFSSNVLMLKSEAFTNAIRAWNKVSGPYALTYRNFWIGLSNEGNDNQTFSWSDGSQLVDWSNWKLPVSQARDDQCVTTNYDDNVWMRYKCNNKAAYVICQTNMYPP